MSDNNQIHPSAVVAEQAKLGENVVIGPYSVIGPNIVIGDNCLLHSHVVMDGRVIIGENNEFFPFCSIGAPPQDVGYKGESTLVTIGNNNVFREYVSVNRATIKESGVTMVKDNSLFMGYVHIGHDCIVGNNAILVNGVNLAGHVKIGDYVTLGGGVMVGQFCSLGRWSYIGGATAVNRDIPPFFTGYGNRILLKGINIIGARRAGVTRENITGVIDFFKRVAKEESSLKSFCALKETQTQFKHNEIVVEIMAFIEKSKRGIAPLKSFANEN